MTPERWQQIKNLFDAVANQPTHERSSYLDQACGDDEELRQEVESLLESEEQEVSIVDRDPLDFFGQLLTGDLGGTREGLVLGQYRLLEEIGRGGMAVVYKAVRADEQFDQEVAIKLIRQGMDNEMMIALFRRERQILANLDHPNIAQLFDGGVTAEGLPYLVMEMIDGEPINAYCDRRNLSITDRLELYRKVCSAVQYAHRNLIVHRDLKPSNILVTKEGVPKLLDFGVAKWLEPESSSEEQIDVDVTSKEYLTPGYASPEQITGGQMTTASDTYSLGVLLYHLLTGRRPYQIEHLSRAEIERVICEQEPERPSAAIARVTPSARITKPLRTPGKISRLRGTSPEELRRKLRGDLDNIILKAMRKEPERRHRSAEQLEEDVRRYLSGLPVSARENTLVYIVGKFVRRHRVGVAAATLVFLSLVGSTVATTWQMRVAQKERLTAQTVSGFLIDLFELSDPEKTRGKEISARTLLERSVNKINALEEQPEVQAELMSTIGRVYMNLGILEEAKPMLDQALEIRQRVLPSNDPAIIDSQAYVAFLSSDRGDYAQAERLAREVLEYRRRYLSEDDKRLAESEIGLGQALERRGKLDEAEELLRGALARQRRALGKENKWVAQTLNILTLVLEGKGQLREAADLYRQALEMTRSQLGDDHPDVANPLDNLARVLCDLGEYEEALSRFEEVAELRRRIEGEEHWSLATTWNNYAICKRLMKDYEGAEQLYRTSLELRRRSLGSNHPYVAESLNNLGNFFYETNKLAQAEPLLREALSIFQQTPGGPHIDRVGPLNNLAMVLQAMDKFDEAESLHREALARNKELYGKEHKRIARNLNNLGEVLRLQGKLEDAAIHLRQALEVGRKSFGPESPDLAIYHLNLANVLRSRNQLAVAEIEYRAAWTLRRKILGPRHPDVASSAIGLGRVLMEQGKLTMAESRLQEALEILVELPPEQQQPLLAMAQATLGRCLASLGRADEAKPLLSKAYESFRHMGGHRSKWAEATQQWLSEIDKEQNESGPI